MKKYPIKKILLGLAFVVIFLSILAQQNFAAETLKFVTDPTQRIDVPFRLFKTENMWTQLLLDTRNGRIWQVCYSVEPNAFRGKLPINNTPLVANNGEIGRFTLYPTENMWTFILLDQETGDVWQCQFSLKTKDDRFILSIPLFGYVVTPAPQRDIFDVVADVPPPAPQSGPWGKNDEIVSPLTTIPPPPKGFTEDVTSTATAQIPPPPKGFVVDKNEPNGRP